ncbi:MAG: hypothetical protein [Betatorquevirus sp.]|nr:MAG: hypothetical protein [Betatorquevirus sp.]
MSDYVKPSEYTNYQKETAWINDIHHVHDIFCFCDNTVNHLLQCLLMRGAQFNLTKQQRRLLQKCLITTEDQDGDGDGASSENQSASKEEDFDLNIGDLEQLFAENDKDG